MPIVFVDDAAVVFVLLAFLLRVRFRLVHIPPDRTPENIDVVLHGHTHVPRHERREGVLFLNPGCVTRPNRGAAASVASLEIARDGKLSWRTIPLR